ncbi:MAG: hypothetical protein HC892_17560 [Saprospiraceae bacterium]|nr:hypothetical protein [Saprospiraceae bacterium]
MRPFLIAYNINLNTTDVAVANQIAYQVRGSGHWTVRNGKKVPFQGKFPSVRAIGWYITEYGKAQVSMNLTDFAQTSMYEVMEACKEAASANHVRVTGSELIGLVPLAALLETGKLYAGTDGLSEEELVDIAIQQLGLNDVKPFDPQKHILEYALSNQKLK